MKKANLLLIVIVAFLLSGCATLDTIAEYSAINPLGVVSVYSNADIRWYGEEKTNTGLLGGIIGDAINQADSEIASTLLSRADQLIDQADQIVLSSLSQVNTVSTIDKTAITSSKAYSHIPDSDLADIISADDYQVIPSVSSGVVSSLNSELGLKGAAIVQFDFTKKMHTGVAQNGTMMAHVQMVVSIKNDEGTLLFSKVYIGQSQDTITVVAGIYDPAALIALFPSVIEQLCDELVFDLNK